MTSLTEYGNVADDVVAELAGVRDKLYAAGVLRSRSSLTRASASPRTDEQNWELLAEPGPA